MLKFTGDEVIEAMLDVVFVVDAHGAVQNINAAAERATGCSRAELADRRIDEVLTAEIVSDNKVLRDKIVGGQARFVGAWLESKSGARIPVLVSATPLVEKPDATDAVLVVAHRTVQRDQDAVSRTPTELELSRALEAAQKQLEDVREQRLRSERFATLGRLAGGVGHELRNIAQLQVLALEALIDALPASPTGTHPAISDLERTCQLVADHAQRLLKLAHPGPDHARPVNLAEVIRDVVVALGGAGKLRGIRTDLLLGDEVLLVAVNKTRVEQVIWNLALNAVEAIGKAGGTLSIAAHGTAQNRVSIEVSDTGHGIAEPTLPRIFEPFFTTKQAGSTGLGLAVAREIVEGHDGVLSVASTAETGTTFRFDLPRVT